MISLIGLMLYSFPDGLVYLFNQLAKSNVNSVGYYDSTLVVCLVQGFVYFLLLYPIFAV